MENNDSLTASQVIAMAAGPTRMASMTHARLIRKTASGLDDKEVNLKKVLQAKATDFFLQPEDILYVPNSRAKAIAQQGTTSILSLITSAALYRF